MSVVAIFTLMGLAILVFTAITVYTLMPTPEPGLLQQRLANVAVDAISVDAIELAKPLRDRAILPLINFVGTLLLRNTKSNQIVEIRRLLRSAGSTMNPESFLFLKMASLVAGTVAGFLIILVGRLSGWQALVALLGALLIAYMFPTRKMKGTAKKHANVLIRAMPGVLDLLIVCMDAGLGFDMALARVCEEDATPLGREFQKALNEIRLGRTRSDALMAMAERNGIEELTVFIRAVLQAEPLGVPISNVLHVQADELRRKRRQRAEERGHKAPVKMLIPMMGCIFPTIFIILLGPAGIQVMHMVGGH